MLDSDRPSDRRHRRRPHPRNRPAVRRRGHADPRRPPQRHRPGRRGRRPHPLRPDRRQPPGGRARNRARNTRPRRRPARRRPPIASMATICTPIWDRETYLDPSCVKVVRSADGRALYFSRRSIPCHRDGEPDPGVEPLGYLHLGLYAYRRDFLLRLAQLPPSPLELAERLEQLRVLESGEPIALGIVAAATPGIDTPEDYRRFLDRWRSREGRPPDSSRDRRIERAVATDPIRPDSVRIPSMTTPLDSDSASISEPPPLACLVLHGLGGGPYEAQPLTEAIQAAESTSRLRSTPATKVPGLGCPAPCGLSGTKPPVPPSIASNRSMERAASPSRAFPQEERWDCTWPRATCRSPGASGSLSRRPTPMVLRASTRTLSALDRSDHSRDSPTNLGRFRPSSSG